MTTAYFLSEADRELVLEFLESVRKTKPATPRRNPNTPVPSKAPEVYVGRPVSRLSIPRRHSAKPGTRQCQVFKMVYDQPTDQWTLIEVLKPDGSVLVVDVFNVTSQDLEWDFYELTRDKFGRWLSSCCQ